MLMFMNSIFTETEPTQPPQTTMATREEGIPTGVHIHKENARAPTRPNAVSDILASLGFDPVSMDAQQQQQLMQQQHLRQRPSG
jgi:hypothetical protein